MRIAQDVIEMVFGTCGLGFGAVLRHVQPALDQRQVCLEMELQAIGTIAIAECLVGAGG